jgi:hypothetical protein
MIEECSMEKNGRQHKFVELRDDYDNNSVVCVNCQKVLRW